MNKQLKKQTQKLTKKLKTKAYELWQDESGQGTAEYVLILVGIVAVALFFKDEVYKIIKGKMADVQSGMDRVK